MSSPFYQNKGPVDCTVKVNVDCLNGKTVLITGGSSGLGAAFVKAYVDAGAFVVNADLSEPTGGNVVKSAVFAKCNVTSWEEQVAAFKTAIEKSPKKGIDIVIANAGIYGPDLLAGLDDDEPQAPNLKLLDVNLIGVLYTARLAAYYFNKRSAADFDRCLIVLSSIMGYIDTQGSSVYGAAKHGVRGAMCCLRRKGAMRVNAIAPWFVATPILPKEFLDLLGKQFRAQGLDFAVPEDAVSAVMRISTDKSINGRTLGVVPKQLSASGYMDFELDDFAPGTPCDILQKMASSINYGEITEKN